MLRPRPIIIILLLLVAVIVIIVEIATETFPIRIMEQAIDVANTTPSASPPPITFQVSKDQFIGNILIIVGALGLFAAGFGFGRIMPAYGFSPRSPKPFRGRVIIRRGEIRFRKLDGRTAFRIGVDDLLAWEDVGLSIGGKIHPGVRLITRRGNYAIAYPRGFPEKHRQALKEFFQ